MIRRACLKFLAAGAACFVLFVVSLGVVGCLAFSTPSFYSELLSTAPNAEAAEQDLQQMRDDFLQWRARSLAIQKGNLPAARDARELARREFGDYTPDGDTHTIRVSEEDINALLAAEEAKRGGGEVKQPRFRVEPGRVLMACTVVTPAGEVIFSAAFVPQQPTGDELRLRLTEARLGRLPLPIATVSRLLPRRNARLQGGLSLDSTGPLPELALQMTKGRGAAVRPKSIECQDGAVVVQLMAPLLSAD